jgi:cytochrome c biogenesis protein CcmG, thiol:disulfide interchange protein DsbE
MRSFSRLLFPALAAMALVAGCDRGGQPAMIGKEAPDFTIRDGARTVTLSQFKGRVVLLNFWAAWCQPCVEEMPDLEQLHRAMPQLELLAVSTDNGETDDLYKKYRAQTAWTFDIVRDASQQSNALYGSYRFPETYVIDRSGIVRRKFIGPQDWASPAMIAYLKQL